MRALVGVKRVIDYAVKVNSILIKEFIIVFYYFSSA